MLCPVGNQVESNCVAPRQCNLGRCAADEPLDSGMLEPAGGNDLLSIDGDFGRIAFSKAADHQIGWKRPGLAREVAHAQSTQANLLKDLAPHRFFDSLT